MRNSSNDLLILSVTCTVIFFVAIFEITFIAVEIYESLFYALHCALSIFLTFNIIGNLIACWYVDTSINCVTLMPSQEAVNFSAWRFCEECNILAPPRSRHCKHCNTCILKRDHHCFFTACCVGHRNYRYFLLCIVYCLIATVYYSALNAYYCWWLHPDIYAELSKLFCFLAPTLILFRLEFNSLDTHYLIIFIFLVVLVGVIFSGLVLGCHCSNILSGASAHERATTLYNLGSRRRNMEMVLGKNLGFVWLAPFVSSKLPHDGVHWNSLLEEIEIKKAALIP